MFVPWLLILALASFVATQLVRRVLRRLGFYRVVWHAGLFDVALFVIVLWLLTLGTAHIGPGSLRN